MVIFVTTRPKGSEVSRLHQQSDAPVSHTSLHVISKLQRPVEIEPATLKNATAVLPTPVGTVSLNPTAISGAHVLDQDTLRDVHEVAAAACYHYPNHNGNLQFACNTVRVHPRGSRPLLAFSGEAAAHLLHEHHLRQQRLKDAATKERLLRSGENELQSDVGLCFTEAAATQRNNRVTDPATAKAKEQLSALLVSTGGGVDPPRDSVVDKSTGSDRTGNTTCRSVRRDSLASIGTLEENQRSLAIGAVSGGAAAAFMQRSMSLGASSSHHIFDNVNVGGGGVGEIAERQSGSMDSVGGPLGTMAVKLTASSINEVTPHTTPTSMHRDSPLHGKNTCTKLSSSPYRPGTHPPYHPSLNSCTTRRMSFSRGASMVAPDHASPLSAAMAGSNASFGRYAFDGGDNGGGSGRGMSAPRCPSETTLNLSSDIHDGALMRSRSMQRLHKQQSHNLSLSGTHNTTTSSAATPPIGPASYCSHLGETGCTPPTAAPMAPSFSTDVSPKAGSRQDHSSRRSSLKSGASSSSAAVVGLTPLPPATAVSSYRPRFQSSTMSPTDALLAAAPPQAIHAVQRPNNEPAFNQCNTAPNDPASGSVSVASYSGDVAGYSCGPNNTCVPTLPVGSDAAHAKLVELFDEYQCCLLREASQLVFAPALNAWCGEVERYARGEVAWLERKSRSNLLSLEMSEALSRAKKAHQEARDHAVRRAEDVLQSESERVARESNELQDRHASEIAEMHTSLAALFGASSKAIFEAEIDFTPRSGDGRSAPSLAGGETTLAVVKRDGVVRGVDYPTKSSSSSLQPSPHIPEDATGSGESGPQSSTVPHEIPLTFAQKIELGRGTDRGRTRSAPVPPGPDPPPDPEQTHESVCTTLDKTNLSEPRCQPRESFRFIPRDYALDD